MEGKKKPKGTFAKLMQSTPPLSQPVIQPQQEIIKTNPPVKQETQAQESKKLLGARITFQQAAAFKKLFLKLNNNESNIEKGEIVGLAIETLANLLEGTTEEFQTVNKLKSYLVNKITSLRES